MYSSTIQSSGHQHDPIIRSAGGIERFQYNIGWKTERVLLRIDAKHLLVWRIISTLKTSRSSSHNYIDNNTTNIIILLYKCVFLAPPHFFLFRPRVFSRALGSVARREPPRTLGASVGPGRCPAGGTCSGGSKWHVPLGEGFRARRAIQVYANPRT